MFESKSKQKSMKTIVLENVKEDHMSLLRELANTLRFSIKSVSDVKPVGEIQSRIEGVETGSTTLVDTDWKQIVKIAGTP